MRRLRRRNSGDSGDPSWTMVIVQSDHAALLVKGRVMEPEKIHLGRAVFRCDWSKNLMNGIINPVPLKSCFNEWLVKYFGVSYWFSSEIRSCCYCFWLFLQLIKEYPKQIVLYVGPLLKPPSAHPSKPTRCGQSVAGFVHVLCFSLNWIIVSAKIWKPWEPVLRAFPPMNAALPIVDTWIQSMPIQKQPFLCNSE